MEQWNTPYEMTKKYSQNKNILYEMELLGTLSILWHILLNNVYSLHL